jgi:hypothetical protein
MGMFDGMDLDWGQIASGMPTPGSAPAPGFNDRFGAAFPRSPIAPEQLAQNLAARGVPPPPVDIPVGAALTGNDGVVNPNEPFRMPDQRSVDNWRADTDVTNAGIGGSPAPKGMGGSAPGAPMNIQSPVQQQQVAQAGAPTDISASAKKPGGDSLLDALKGIKAPASPEIQRFGTPAAPKVTANIKGGNLLAMLQALNVGQGAGDRNLPATLASALRRG